VAEPNRDTIYVDIDDEITGIIDKVRGSNAKIVALVLPKRAAVFQSVVNMKLLKRATEQSKKHIVLITSEAGLLPLAGAVGVYVASTLTTKPEIPAAPLVDDGREEMVEESASMADDDPDEITVTTAGSKPVGELAGLPPVGADGVETVELNDEDDDLPVAAAAAPMSKKANKKAAKKAKDTDKKLHVPNFERFRVLFIVGILLILVIVAALILGLSVLPKASIAIQTDATDVNTNVNLTLDTSASSLDTQTNTVPAKQVSEQKTYTATVAATGQQNNGQEASGTINMSAEECGTVASAQDVPAGTGVSTNGNTYITQGDTTFNYSKIKGNCIYFTANTPTGITAQSPGSAYNTSSSTASFTVAGRSDVTATGSATGGTDNIQTIVQQSDIANAEGKISTQDSSVKQDLEQQLQQDNFYAIPATFSTGSPTTTPSTAAGSPASNVTVTEAITYTMYGARQTDLDTLLTNNVKSQVNNGQGILSLGLANGTFTTTGGSGNDTSLTLATTAEVGPNINVATIKQQAVGKKTADVESTIKSDSDVTNVTVHLSPFWVTSVPKKLSKITVTIAKPTANASSSSNP
jgi:hypothetical protein